MRNKHDLLLIFKESTFQEISQINCVFLQISGVKLWLTDAIP